MPDLQGRLTLLEMRTTVWENLAAVYPGSVDPVTGQAFNPIIDPLFTQQAIDRYINESLTKHCIDIFTNNAELLEDSAVLNVVANTPEVELPEDVALVRSCWWKPANVPPMQAPPSERAFMFNLDDPAFGQGGSGLRQPQVPSLASPRPIPNYRLRLDFIVLEPVSPVDNNEGVLVRYIKWINYLGQDDQIIETPFARILQECVILGASIAAAGRKAFLDTSELKTSYVEFRTQLVELARQFFSPTSSFITTAHPIKLRGAAGGRTSRRVIIE